MTRPTDEVLLAFLEETLGEEERAKVLEQLAADPELAAELERAATALEALRSMPVAAPASTGKERGRISPWWLVVASAATLAIAIPTTLRFAGGGPGVATDAIEEGRPGAPEFVLVLRGRWSDDIQLEPDEFQNRLDELRAWTSRLAADGVLVAASDLALEQGVRYGPSDGSVPELAQSPDYVIGVLTLRMNAYHEALAIARSCPHLRFGGTVTVRRVGGGFFTITDTPDYTS